jgi:hypothetical protein
VRDILTPYAGAKPGVSIVREADNLFLIVPRLRGNDRTEGFLLDDAAVVGGIIDDGGLNEETLPGGDVLGPDGKGVAALLGVAEVIDDLVVLHAVLDGAEMGVLGGGADGEGLGESNHGFKHLGIDVFVDVDCKGYEG